MNIPSSSGTVKQRVKLFRNRKQLIEANLAPLKETTKKKELAQDFYYSNQPEDVNQSPLKRGPDYKPPVHRRLGRKIALRRNNAANSPGITTAKNGNLKNSAKTNWRSRQNGNVGNATFSNQYRILRAKEGFRTATVGILPAKVRLRQNIRRAPPQRHNHPPATHQQHVTTSPTPINYTVQVENNGYRQPDSNNEPDDGITPKRHSLKGSLSPAIQDVIRVIQDASPKVIGSLPPSTTSIRTLSDGHTKFMMHSRFSSYP